MQPDIKKLISIIRKDYPELHIHSVHHIREGLGTTALDINNELIFRFPVNSYKGRKFQREVRILNLLASKKISPIPVIAYLGKKEEYMGYRKLPGSTVSPKTYENMGSSARTVLAQQIAAFLISLHASFTIDEARKIGVQEYFFEDPASILRKILALPEVSEEIVELAKRAAQERETVVSAPSFLRVLHWDIHNGNFLIEAKSGTLTGVIDFSDMIIADLHCEFRSLYRFDYLLAKETLCWYKKLTQLDLSFRRAQLSAWLIDLQRLTVSEKGVENGTYERAQDRLMRWARIEQKENTSLDC